jgi:predicted metal-dependent hydrolase
MNASTRTIIYGKEPITFNLKFCDRKTLDISVHPNQHITVTAPLNTLPETIDQKVKNHARWILKQQTFFEQFEPRTPSRQYVSGETHLYLGRQYRLKILSAETSSVKLLGQYILLNSPEALNPNFNQALLETWYLERAQFKFSERLISCFAPFHRMGFEQPNILIRSLTKRWGSLTARGRLILNRDLIRASSRCIDYVITHELCHLKYPDHSADFYSLISRTMPDWEHRKQMLERKLS